jgi:hypothetical protein
LPPRFLVEPARCGEGRSVAIDASPIAFLTIAGQPIGIVIDLDGGDKSGRGHGDHVSLHVMNRMVILSRRVCRHRGKSKAQGKRNRREFHCPPFRPKAPSPLAELDLIERTEETTSRASAL